MASRFLSTLKGDGISPPPIWLMRQAGRYLPEYRAVRAEAGDFLKLCFDPEKASEVTLQPIRRYDFDAAILFADILLVPLAIGQKVWFEAGEGPRLAPPLKDNPSVIKDLSLSSLHDRLEPIYETVMRVRRELADEKTLIGFAGAPWTVATYMLAGAGSKDPSALRLFAYQHPGAMADLMTLLEQATADYLIAQAEAGAGALKLFDSWASGLPEDLFETLCVGPVERITKTVKAAVPNIPIIAFPRGGGPMMEKVARLETVDGIAIDTGMSWSYARESLSPHAVVQGGLDPLLLIEGGDALERSARRLIQTFKGTPFIFNTGHGLVPEIPPENVGRLVDIVREGV